MKSMKNRSMYAVPVYRSGWVTTDKWNTLRLGLLAVVSSLFLTSCGVYSFSPAKIPDDVKSVTVNNFTLQTAGGPANLPLTLTERLKEYYQRNTNLKLLPTGGELALEGAISGYDLIAVAPTSSDQAGQNRLQITIQVRFTNTRDDTKSFDQSFSFYRDFPPSQTLSQVENQLIPPILDQLVLDVFNKTAADW